jgi:HPt (histidine-containing phosphotransfer) domain-containing protein
MNDPVDLTSLREMIGNDIELEKSLFELFITSSDESIAQLEQSCTEGENINWKNHAHAFKGSAANIGAGKLAEHCGTAQKLFNASATEKQQILHDIKAEYAITKTFLEGLH